MNRRLFLKMMGIAAATHAVPSFATYRIEPTTVALENRSENRPLNSSSSDLEDWATNIMVVGVGGAGGNALAHMIHEGTRNVHLLAFDTDARALARNPAPFKLVLGKSGLGAGAQPDAGKIAAEESRSAIRASLSGAHMVFLVAGMGGGTGTGATPLIAEVAQEMGILTVGVVTKPFSFEGEQRLRHAEAAIVELTKRVDSLIVTPNDNLIDVLGADAHLDECFRSADDVLKNAVSAIADIITYPGLVAVDFEDVRTVTSEMGRAKVGFAVAAGSNRAHRAATQAIKSPFMNGVDLSCARGVLVCITATKRLKMKEVNDVLNVVRATLADDAHIIFGAVYDEAMGEAFRVTVIAAGFDTGGETNTTQLA